MLNKKALGDRMASFMKRQKISQAKLVTILKEKGAGEVTQATISNWTLGYTSAPLELAPVLCEIFEISLHELFGTHIEADGTNQMKSIKHEFEDSPDIAFNKLVSEYATLLETMKQYRKEKDGAQKRLDEIYSVYQKHLKSKD